MRIIYNVYKVYNKRVGTGNCYEKEITQEEIAEFKTEKSAEEHIEERLIEGEYCIKKVFVNDEL